MPQEGSSVFSLFSLIKLHLASHPLASSYSHVAVSSVFCPQYYIHISAQTRGAPLRYARFFLYKSALFSATPVAQSAPRNLLTRWDESSIPANGIFPTKNKKNKIKMPNGWRTINSLVHKIRLHGRRGKGMAESFSRQKSRHAPQKEGGLKILCDLPPV